ncbi:spermidine/putrescine ABC transporter permease [Leucobacter sp. OLJS4]|uniref:ABC transporter permease n=1 Tax=unclassified Leucobacter TaxID=2621730 RepID=UPI000C19FA92|nr:MULTISPECIES: ABC transporter permease [unclassified Leucobacter]PII84851.1 spermidine/putrescine ABC transporter permease [Leucobacter sp. OLCALW19]PII87719.1 spermidine/putrescine ABC transporter permease [Leucobacter sp. OLTLW20]PII93806.1 spermidine/putrescine ABC transporter permease [Leucobacter sp. OLAS13]PII98523.1 spermidine/putrescine ABC transporter permease [Leucobacter sp. OLDS2]PIJ00504.1 spermidine/putrescine ABC transporter permease [Leucobacter sp. OLCS4]
MSTSTAAPATAVVARTPSLARRFSSFLYAHPRLRLTMLLTAPLFWLGLVYIVALVLLLVTAFWTTDSFTGAINTTFTLDNVIGVVTDSLYQTVTLRTVFVALCVTVIDVALALPIAFFMAKVASPRTQRILMILVLTPLWASYLVKAYAWRSVLSEDGLLSWLLTPVGGGTPGYGLPATIITLSYLWLPYVILPIQAGLERVPDSLLEASSDLGGKSWRTIRSVVLPMAVPAIIAGTIFSFSLSLGDYITVRIVGGTSQMLGNLVYDNVGSANNLPLASAIALIPMVIIFIYLFIVRRTGALDNL